MSTTYADLPLWKAREPENRDAALAVLQRAWLLPAYREGVRQAFAQAESALPHLYLGHVPQTDVWLSYVIDQGTHKIIMASINNEAELPRETA